MSLPEGVEVVKTSLGTYILYFVMYIILHIVIGVIYKDIKEQLEKDKNNKNLIEQEKYLKHIFNWFPVAYLIFIIIILAI